MRTLGATLTTAQQANAVKPYIKVVANYGETTYTFDTHGYDGASKRIKGVEATEEPYGGRATILLDNSDAYFLSKNLKGYDITLSWGA